MQPEITYTDTHAHLNLPAFKHDVDATIKNAKKHGVARIVCVGTGVDSTQRCIELAKRFPATLTATAGIHPNYCNAHGKTEISELKLMADSPHVTAIGETGLDFHHKYCDREVQKTFFRLHIELALNTGKPLIIHGRRADEEILNILDEYTNSPPGIRHCFDSSAQVANEYVSRGFHVAFGGLVTKEGHKKLKKAAASVPDNKLLLETDCPYITPQGLGNGRNEPGNIHHVAEALATLRKTGEKNIAKITTRNAARLGLIAESITER